MLLCYVLQFSIPLDMGVHMLIVGAATCLCRCCGILCNLGWVVEGLENIFPMVTHVLGESKF